MRDAVAATIASAPVIGVVRTDSRDEAEGIAATLIEGGIRLIEVTLAVPGATDLVQTLALARGEENR